VTDVELLTEQGPCSVFLFSCAPSISRPCTNGMCHIRYSSHGYSWGPCTDVVQGYEQVTFLQNVLSVDVLVCQKMELHVPLLRENALLTTNHVLEHGDSVARRCPWCRVLSYDWASRMGRHTAQTYHMKLGLTAQSDFQTQM
jgi:hypothetical protein